MTTMRPRKAGLKNFISSAEARTQRDPSEFEQPVALAPITDAGEPPPADEEGPPEPTTVGPVDEPPDSPGAIAPR